MADGLVTLFHWIETAPEGVVAQVAVIRKLPVTAVLLVQPVVQPSPDGWLAKVDEPLVKPAGVVQAPEAVVQAWAATDWTAVPVVGKAAELSV